MKVVNKSIFLSQFTLITIDEQRIIRFDYVGNINYKYIIVLKALRILNNYINSKLTR